MKSFNHFIEEKFKLSHWASFQRDSRGPNVDIETGTIFKALSFQPVLPGVRSLLGMDAWLRMRQARDLFKSKRNMVASDTTIARSLGGWDTDRLRATLRASIVQMKSEGRLKVHLSSGRVFRPCIVDGSGFGGFLASVLIRIGDEMTCGVDAEPFPKRGMELAASRQMVDRAAKQFGAGFASHLIYDGLMAVKADFDKSLNVWGMHLMVKTSEKGLLPVVWANELFDAGFSEKDMKELGVLVSEGEDKKVSYEVCSVAGVEWEGMSLPLNVARVTEFHHSGKYKGQTFVFWVLTTDLTLFPSEMRELAHIRWRIENNQFKELNELVGSKRAYIKNPTVKLSMLLIWFWSWTAFQAFRLLKCVQRFLKGVKATKHFLQQLILFDEIPYILDSS